MGVNLIYSRLQTSKRISRNFFVQVSNLFYHLDSSPQVFNDLDKSHSPDSQMSVNVKNLPIYHAIIIISLYASEMHSLSQLSVLERSSCCGALPEWGRSKMSNGHLPVHLVLWMRCDGQSPCEFLFQPHSDRGSRQLLLSIPDRSVFSWHYQDYKLDIIKEIAHW